jgi:undecaprenyl diphosphate synthase
MFLFKNKKNKVQTNEYNIDYETLPNHIAIIMDGNGRWAKQRGLPRTAGHRAGVEALRETIKTSSDIGIKILTFYAFSTENWKRPKNEVEALMSLLVEYLYKEIQELNKNNVKIALNYGGRDELIYAIKNIVNDCQKGILKSQDIDENTIESYLYTSQQADPDLLIRTSGELRLSNFLLWQIAYTEFWFTDILWPDFKKEHLFQAIASYQNRDRRYGGISKK